MSLVIEPKSILFRFSPLMAGVLVLGFQELHAQDAAKADGKNAPRVVVPSSAQQSQGRAPGSRVLYPWKTYVTCTVFWIGELPTENNPVPNLKSSWDVRWKENYGGYDDPEPINRIADHMRGDFRPKAFIPKLNPFYIALPYNDLASGGGYKPEAAKVIPWFKSQRVDGRVQTVLKGRWVQIFKSGRSCYAQWEDCGPWETDDWQFVFGNRPPLNKNNHGAGIDISPAVRDYLLLKSADKVHWRFVEESQVPHGPWKKYGQGPKTEGNPDLDAQRAYLEYLRKMRDEQFLKKPLRELQRY